MSFNEKMSDTKSQVRKIFHIFRLFLLNGLPFMDIDGMIMSLADAIVAYNGLLFEGIYLECRDENNCSTPTPKLFGVEDSSLRSMPCSSLSASSLPLISLQKHDEHVVQRVFALRIREALQ